MSVTRLRARGFLLVVLAVMGSACGSAKSGSHPPPLKPVRIYPGPAGILSGTTPSDTGGMWILADGGGAATIRQLDLHTGLMTAPVPVPSSAVAIAEGVSGRLGIGLATATTGALEIVNAATPLSSATVPLGAPVKAVAATNSRFYVLDGDSSSTSVSVVDPQRLLVATLPAPLDAISITVSADGHNIYALEPSGRVTQIDASTGRAIAAFPTGGSARAIILSPDGMTLFVLQGDSIRDTAIINVETESQQKAIPAPANSVGLATGADGTTIYALVGTRALGNIQAFSLGAEHQ